MSVGGFIGLVAVIAGIAAIAYIWSRVTGDGLALTDGTPGSVLDSGETVRRVDLGTNGFVGQAVKAELDELGLKTQLVSLEEGAFGIGMGAHYWLAYNAEDEGVVLPVVDRLLGGFAIEDANVDDDHAHGAPDSSASTINEASAITDDGPDQATV